MNRVLRGVRSLDSRPRRIIGLLLVAAVAGCTNFYEIPIETPIQPKMDVSPFTRVLVAGFIGGGTDDVDANLETVRLLRSQLRSKSTLRVIETEALPLEEIAREHVAKRAEAENGSTRIAMNSQGRDGPGPIDPAQEGGQGQTPPPVPPLPEPSADEPSLPPVPGVVDENRIRSEQDLEQFQSFFDDTEFWKKLGEEHEHPLIVTGTILFTNTQASGFVNTTREAIDELGRRVVQPQRVYMERKGFIIEPRFIFIDGRTGEVLYTDRFHEEILYPAQQNVPALSSYFELMDRLIPSFLGSFSTQRIRGTRVLLK